MTITQLINRHPEMHLMMTADVMSIISWMKKNLPFQDCVDIYGEVCMTTIAETTITECPLIDENDLSIWETDSGGIWDAVYIFGTWMEESD